MNLGLLINRGLKPLLAVSRRQIINHKFSYGQGGSCELALSNRNYLVQLQTVWEDEVNIQIEGSTEEQEFLLYQSQGKAVISDQKLNKNEDQTVKLKIQVPEDYTFWGILNGSLKQEKNPLTTNKLRSNSLTLEILGQNRVFELNQLETQKINLKSTGLVSINKLTLQEGSIKCFNFISQKTMISKHLKIDSKNQANIHSLIMYADALGEVECKTFKADSVSGMAKISTKMLEIKRLYKSLSTQKHQCSEISTEEILECKIETGDVQVQLKGEKRGQVTTGKGYKGRVEIRESSEKTIISAKQ